MYVVKSGAGYVTDEDSLEMTSDITEAGRFSFGVAAYLLDCLREDGVEATPIRVSDQTVEL